MKKIKGLTPIVIDAKDRDLYDDKELIKQKLFPIYVDLRSFQSLEIMSEDMAENIKEVVEQ